MGQQAAQVGGEFRQRLIGAGEGVAEGEGRREPRHPGGVAAQERRVFAPARLGLAVAGWPGVEPFGGDRDGREGRQSLVQGLVKADGVFGVPEAAPEPGPAAAPSGMEEDRGIVGGGERKGHAGPRKGHVPWAH